ncbi:MAG: isoprenylcysteine carboxylmethyltransferase family protein [Calditrichaeota bacterium]|nr:isoprenylcysteine carboxylmethyltransferase family protein [Calditrichota bacterium]RQW02283.1 MAG: isoprenylcysteine carboxylmethyltransferase family protein [Calditrichota bacterium]
MNIQLIIRGAMVLFVLGIILLLIAGRTSYWQAWVFCAICFLLVVGLSIVFGKDFDSIKERMKSGPGTKWWDKLFWAIYGPMNMAIVIVAALDAGRFLWSVTLPWFVYSTGYFIFVFSAILHLWAIYSNKFYAKTVRIQGEKEQVVIESGPYRYVRHPGYIGIMLMVTSMAVVLGSLRALIPALIVSVLLFIRTILEDYTLLQELAGYRDYSQKVRYRLIPGVW